MVDVVGTEDILARSGSTPGHDHMYGQIRTVGAGGLFR